MTYLTPQQLLFQDLWRKLGYREPLFFVKIARVALLDPPVPVLQHLSGLKVRNMFFLASAESKRRLLDSQTCSGPVRAVIEQWREAFPRLRGADTASAPDLRLCASLFAPHCLLCAHGLWASFCFPVPCGRHANGLGLNLVRSMIGKVNARAGDPAAEEAPALTPERLQSLTDLLRMLSQQCPDHHNDIVHHVTWLQSVRDSMVHDSHVRGQRAYSMSHLINCVLLTSKGKDSHSLRDVLRGQSKSQSAKSPCARTTCDCWTQNARFLQPRRFTDTGSRCIWPTARWFPS